VVPSADALDLVAVLGAPVVLLDQDDVDRPTVAFCKQGGKAAGFAQAAWVEGAYGDVTLPGVASGGVPDASGVVGGARVGAEPALARVAKGGVPNVTGMKGGTGIRSKEGSDGSPKPFT